MSKTTVLDSIADLIGVSGGGASILAPLCILASAFAASTIAVITIQTNRSNSRKKNSMDFLNSYNGSERVSAAEVNIINSLRGKEPEFCAKLADPDSDTTEEEKKIAADIRLVLNYYEDMAVCIAYGIYDSKIIKQAVYTTVTDIWDYSKPYVKKRRELRNRNSFYQDVQYLIYVWGKKIPKRNLPLSYRAKNKAKKIWVSHVKSRFKKPQLPDKE